MNENGALCLRFDIDTFSTRHAFTADVGWGEYPYLPHLLQIASIHKVKFQFCTCGQGLREYPSEHQLILKDGHAIDSHLYTHQVTLLDPPALVAEELVLTEQTFAEYRIPWKGIGATGMYPNGIDHQPEIQELLTQRGYQWCSTKYKKNSALNDMQPYWLNEHLLEIPCAGLSDRNYFYDKTAPVEGFTNHVLTLLEQAHDQGLIYAVCLHPGVLARYDSQYYFVTTVVSRAMDLGIPLLTLNQIRQMYADQQEIELCEKEMI